MHTVDVIVVCTAVVIVVLFAGILARQRYMLRTTGAVPLAMQRGNRWLYGIGRYRGGELRFYRALGVGTHPTRVLRRGHVQVLGRRAPLESERGSLPATAVIIELPEYKFAFRFFGNCFSSVRAAGINYYNFFTGFFQFGDYLIM